MIKALFVREIFKFLSRLFGYVEKPLDEKTKIKFKAFDVTGWKTNNSNTYIVQYLQK